MVTGNVNFDLHFDKIGHQIQCEKHQIHVFNFFSLMQHLPSLTPSAGQQNLFPPILTVVTTPKSPPLTCHLPLHPAWAAGQLGLTTTTQLVVPATMNS